MRSRCSCCISKLCLSISRSSWRIWFAITFSGGGATVSTADFTAMPIAAPAIISPNVGGGAVTIGAPTIMPPPKMGAGGGGGGATTTVFSITVVLLMIVGGAGAGAGFGAGAAAGAGVGAGAGFAAGAGAGAAGADAFSADAGGLAFICAANLEGAGLAGVAFEAVPPMRPLLPICAASAERIGCKTKTTAANIDAAAPRYRENAGAESSWAISGVGAEPAAECKAAPPSTAVPARGAGPDGPT